METKLNKDTTPKLNNKSVYSIPKLKSYGNAVEITLGGGGGTTDGGGKFSHK
jgi:hypothetical protein